MVPPGEERRTAPPTREQFALTGPSRSIDPRRQAVRRDLADVRLASIVFAPHYAAPLALTLAHDAVLRSGPEPDSEKLADLPTGTRFELLERSGGHGWGVVPDRELVGYVDEDALGHPAPPA